MKILNRILRSSKVQKDAILKYNKEGSLQVISISGLSLIAPIKKKLLSIRKKIDTLKIERSQKKMALIIPYRQREEHLAKFIPCICKYLEMQKIDYEIIIAQQEDNFPFNRAKLFNVGTLYASEDVEYFVFHDVDLLPLNIDYRFSNHPLRPFQYIQEESLSKKYAEVIFGGVTIISKDIFLNINGFSNNYWQWGKEDDDFLMRLLFNGYTPLFDTDGKLNALPHPPSLSVTTKGKETNDKKTIKENTKLYQKNRKRFSNFKRGLTLQEEDGINSITDYKIKKIKSNDKIKTIFISFETN